MQVVILFLLTPVLSIRRGKKKTFPDGSAGEEI